MNVEFLHLKILTAQGRELQDLAIKLEDWSGRSLLSLPTGLGWLRSSHQDDQVRMWCNVVFKSLRPRLNRGNKKVIDLGGRQ